MNWLLHIMGNTDEAGGWSGFGGATAIFTGLFGSVMVHYRQAERHHRERMAQSAEHHEALKARIAGQVRR